MALIRIGGAGAGAGIKEIAWCDYRSANSYAAIISEDSAVSSDGTLISSNTFEVERSGQTASIKALIAGDYEVCTSAASGNLTFTTVTATAGQTIASGTSVIAYVKA